MNRPKNNPFWHIYIRKGVAYIPNVARTEAGFFLDVEPVRIAKLDELQLLVSAIEHAMAAGNPQIPTPSRNEYKKSFLIELTGVRSWKAFERTGICFTICRLAEGIEIVETARNEDGQWVDAPMLKQQLPANSAALEIAKRIRERASQHGQNGIQ